VYNTVKSGENTYKATAKALGIVQHHKLRPPEKAFYPNSSRNHYSYFTLRSVITKVGSAVDSANSRPLIPSDWKNMML
jgi:hypothetical protein